MATKPTKNKATAPKANKAAPKQSEQAPEAVVERDTFGVSFCIIARPEDLKALSRCMASLPNNAQV